MRERWVQKVSFLMLTVMLMLAAALCFNIRMARAAWHPLFSDTAGVQAAAGRKTEEDYREKEEQLCQGVRELLAEEGFGNSGVMLTRVVDAQGNREYTVTIHHRGISRMDEAGRAELLEKLSELAFEEEGCSFSQEFLTED